MIWVLVALVILTLLIRAFSKDEETVRFNRSMTTDTWNDEYDPDVPVATHTYRITSSPQEEQSWLSSLAQPYDLDSLSVQIVSHGRSLQVSVRVRGEDADAFIEELPGKISAHRSVEQSPTDEW